ncbi:spinster family MFS transporter [Spirosoma daeguense]
MVRQNFTGIDKFNLLESTTALRQSWYVIGILTLAYVSSFIDRQILSLLVEPIKRDLQVSDTQISLLMGLSFGIFYTLLGIPLARLADLRSRKQIVAWGIGLWSLMTAVCGMAGNFTQLFFARMGVGVGEATLSPAAYSMIADLFPKSKLAMANSVYNMGIFIGSGLAFLIGGLVINLVKVQTMWHIPLIGDVFPWQVVFFVVGLPGLLIVFLISRIKEPIRKGGEGDKATLTQTWIFMLKNAKTYMAINLGLGFLTLVNYANSAWIPSFFVRTYGWSASKSGSVFGILIFILGPLGLWFGGKLADNLIKKGYQDGRLRACVYLIGAFSLTGWVFPLMSEGIWAACAIIPVAFFSSSPLGAGTAAIAAVTPNRMRAMASAVYLFIVNILGLVFGPLSVALLTDKYFQDTTMIRYSILIVTILGTLLGVFFMYLSLKPYRQMVDKAQN